MKAYQLIARAIPDAAHPALFRQMFDEAWNSIASKYGTPLAIGAARLALASAIVIAASNGLDAEDIKRVALMIVAPDLEG
jgi:hypothetical protein